MNELLSLEQIEQQCPNKWVLIGQPEIDSVDRLLRGVVLFESRSRDEVDKKLLELRPKEFALRYFGAPCEDVALVL